MSNHIPLLTPSPPLSPNSRTEASLLSLLSPLSSSIPLIDSVNYCSKSPCKCQEDIQILKHKYKQLKKRLRRMKEREKEKNQDDWRSPNGFVSKRLVKIGSERKFERKSDCSTQCENK